MASSAFERVIELQLDRFSPEEAKRRHVAIARRGLAAFIGRQREKPAWRIEVDGHPAASEDQVRPYGVIAYRFFRWPQIARFSIQTARDLSPVESGDYKKSWFLIADGAEVLESAVPANVARLILCNDVPYAKKIHVRGARLRGVPPGIVEKVRQLVLRRFGGIVTANIEFLTLSGGYVLQGGSPLKRAAQDRRSSVFRAGRTHLRSRADSAKGRNLTYPALVMIPRV